MNFESGDVLDRQTDQDFQHARFQSNVLHEDKSSYPHQDTIFSQVFSLTS